MANEFSAALRGTPPMVGLDEDDYQTFSAALGASGRGRAFLQEYARRNRHADTAVVLAALDRLETLARSQNSVPEAARIRQDLRALLDTIRQARPQIDSSPGAIKAATLSALLEFVQARIESLLAPGPLAALAEVPPSDQPELPIPRPGAPLRSIALVQPVVPPLPEAKRAPVSREQENYALELDPRVGPVFGESTEPPRATEIIPAIDFVDGLFETNAEPEQPQAELTAPAEVGLDVAALPEITVALAQSETVAAPAVDATSGPGSIELWDMPPVETSAVARDAMPAQAEEPSASIVDMVAAPALDQVPDQAPDQILNGQNDSGAFVAETAAPEMTQEIPLTGGRELAHQAVHEIPLETAEQPGGDMTKPVAQQLSAEMAQDAVAAMTEETPVTLDLTAEQTIASDVAAPASPDLRIDREATSESVQDVFVETSFAVDVVLEEAGQTADVEIVQEAADAALPETAEKAGHEREQAVALGATDESAAQAAGDSFKDAFLETPQAALQEIPEGTHQETLQETQEDTSGVTVPEASSQIVWETVRETCEETFQPAFDETAPQSIVTSGLESVQPAAQAHDQIHDQVHGPALAGATTVSITTVGATEYFRSIVPSPVAAEATPPLAVETAAKPVHAALSAIMALSEDERIALFT